MTVKTAPLIHHSTGKLNLVFDFGESELNLKLLLRVLPALFKPKPCYLYYLSVKSKLRKMTVEKHEGMGR